MSQPFLSLSIVVDFDIFLARLSWLIQLCQSGRALIDILCEYGAENTFCRVRGELLAGKISITPFREGDGSVNRADQRGWQIWLRSIRRIESRDYVRHSRIRGYVRLDAVHEFAESGRTVIIPAGLWQSGRERGFMASVKSIRWPERFVYIYIYIYSPNFCVYLKFS